MPFGGSPTPCIRVTAFLPRQTTGCQLLSYTGDRARPLADRPGAGGAGPPFRARINPAVPVLSKLPDVCAHGAAPPYISAELSASRAAALEQTMPKGFVKSAAA